MSPPTISTLGSPRQAAPRRQSSRTRCFAARSFSTRRRPRNPVAPVTRTLSIGSEGHGLGRLAGLDEHRPDPLLAALGVDVHPVVRPIDILRVPENIDWADYWVNV